MKNTFTSILRSVVQWFRSARRVQPHPRIRPEELREALREMLADPQDRALLLGSFLELAPLKGGTCNTPAGEVAPGIFGSACVPPSTENYSFPGNLGVGKSPPDHRLDVAKTFTDATGHNIFSAPNQTVTTAGIYHVQGLHIYTNTNIIGVTNSGYFIGLGIEGLRENGGDTGTLQDLLGADIQYGHYGATSRGTVNAYGLRVTPYHAGGAITSSYGVYIGGAVSGGTVSSYFALYQADPAAKNYFAGNVGIGTIPPDFRLQCSFFEPPPIGPPVNAGSVGLAIRNTNTTPNNWAGVVFPQDPGVNWQDGGAGIFAQHVSRAYPRQVDLAFFTLSGASFGERMRILGNGNVGIGTLIPAEKLQVAGNVKADGFIGPPRMMLTHALFALAAGEDIGSASFSAGDGSMEAQTGITPNSHDETLGGVVNRNNLTQTENLTTGLHRSGAFLSARARWNSAIQSSHQFYILAGGVSGGAFLQSGFGFKAIGSALKGVTMVNGTQTVVDLATTLSSGTFVELLAVRRGSSVEFNVNGVLKGSSSSNLPSSAASTYEVRTENGASATNAVLQVGYLTVGFPM